MNTEPSRTSPLRVTTWIVIALAGLLTTALCIKMLPEWRHNPDLSHGLFAPVMFLLLLHEGRRRGPERYLADSISLRIVRAFSLVGSLAFVCFAGLYAAAIEWGHGLVDFALSLSLCGLLFATLLWLSTTRVRALPLNWSTFIAVTLWPLCASIPPGTYSKLTLQLQYFVTHVVLWALHVLGISASTSGNIIQLAHTSVGVEEACSGVRSLLSCIVAGLFFSATLVRRPWARVLLIALAPLLALGMNIIRSLTLTLLANANVDITGTIHDITGFAVLGVTALILGGLALCLEAPSPAAPAPAPAIPPVTSSPPWGLLAGYATICTLIAFFILKTQPATQQSGRAPNLEAMIPASPAGWDIVQTDDLYRFVSILETDHLIQRTYVRDRQKLGEEDPLQVTVYIAYWSPGQAPVSLVASHTPDACWPAGGWTQHAPKNIPVVFKTSGHTLPLPEVRSFSQASYYQNVWYWHLYDGRSVTQNNPFSPLTMMNLVLKYGFRPPGEQLFVRISSNREWSEIKDDPLLTGILARLRPYGL